MKKKIHAVILAGGSGTRFWPMSRQSRPKQFLSLVGKESLLRQTVERILSEVPAENVWIVAGRAHQRQIKRHVAGLKVRPSQILWEPCGRNTAPAIAWAAARIANVDPTAVLAVFPSDHLIQNKKAFLRVLDTAAAAARQEYLVTLGIVPTRAETGYGYVQAGERIRGNVWKVARFTEKPDLSTARRFVKRKDYFWNSGMFLWRADVILREFEKHLPGIYQALQRDPGQAGVRKIWGRLPSISVDCGILEKARRVAVVPAAGIGWSDLGSWESLAEILPHDASGNSLQGDVLAMNCRNTLIRADKRLIAAVGLEGIVIVDTPDALLVCPSALSQKVKDVVAVLGQRRRQK